MKYSIALLLAAIFCFGGMTNANAAAPTMDLSHHHWHHHHWYYWHHHHYWHHWHHRYW